MNKLECTIDKEKIKLVSSTVMLCLVYIFKTREAKMDKEKKDKSVFIMGFLFLLFSN